jgi:RNA polymerase sigma-70 factor (ECF subfamily)
VLINGAAGVMSFVTGEPPALMAFTIVDDRIVALDVLTDPRPPPHPYLRLIMKLAPDRSDKWWR